MTIARLGFLLVFPAVLAFPQTNIGRISGTVTDSTGAAVPDCPVEAVDAKGLKLVTRTDTGGDYLFPSLSAGTYEIRVEKQGFRSARETGVVLDAASQRTVSFRLEVGQVIETVNASSSAEQVQTTTGNVGRVINEQQVSQIALNGREYMQLLRLSPGVVSATLNVFNPQLALNQQNVNGIRTQSSYFLVDGAENHDAGANSNGIVDPNVDAIAELKMETSSGAAFPNRIVPASRWSRNGAALLKPYPLPNFFGPGGNYVATGIAKTDYREELLRLDYNISPKTQLSYRFTHDKWYLVFPFRNNTLDFVPNPRPRPGYVTSINLQHSFSPTMINSFSFSVSRNKIQGSPDFSKITRPALGLTFAEIYTANRSNVAPQVNLSGFAGYNSGDRITTANGNFQWRDDFTKVLGSHTLKFGAQITRSRKNEDTNVRDEGNVTFNTSALLSSKNVVADALLGNFQSYTEVEADSFWWARFSQYEFYAQDSWRASKRLTFELGLRYNIIPPFYNAQGNASTWLPRLFNPANAPQLTPGDGSVTPGTGDPFNGIAIFGSQFPDAAKGRLPQYDDPSLKRLFVGLPAGGSKTN